MIRFVTNTVVPLGRRTWEKFQADEGGNMAASLAYYALFSLFPLLLVTLSLLGYVASPGSDVQADILTLAAASLPASAYEVVQDALASLTENRGSVGLFGFVTLLLGASGFFGALDRALDKVWATGEEPPRAGGIVKAVLSAVREKALAFALVLGSVLLVLLSTVANLVLGTLLELAGDFAAPAGLSWADVALAQAAQVAVSFVVLAIVLALLYRVLPSASVAWGDVWPAAVVASLLFLALQRLVVGGVINLGGNYQAYGVIGGVMLLLFWLYLSLQVLLLGAELSCAFAERHGSRRKQRDAVPDADATQPMTPDTALETERRAEERAARAAGVGVLVGAAATVTMSVMVLAAGVARALRLVRKR
jgi:membrane protein